jgi:hypothetical protein
MKHMIMCIPYMSNYYLCDFLEIIDNKKIEENNGSDDDVYILHIKRYTINTCIGFGR